MAQVGGGCAGTRERRQSAALHAPVLKTSGMRPGAPIGTQSICDTNVTHSWLEACCLASRSD